MNHDSSTPCWGCSSGRKLLTPYQPHSGHGRPMPSAALFAATLLLTANTPALPAVYSVPSAQYPTIKSAVAAVPTLPNTLTEPITIEVAPGIYREEVEVKDKGTTPAKPLVIRATGLAVIEGGENPQLWTYCGGTTWYAKLGAPLGAPYDSDLVFVNDIPYAPCGPGCVDCEVQPHQYYYRAADTTLFVNTGGFADPNTWVRVADFGFDIRRSNYVRLDGFTIYRTRGRGIRIQGADSTNRIKRSTASNCTVAYNSRHGIYLEFASACSVLSNTVHRNGRHGIYLLTSDSCLVRGNESYRNDNPLRPGISGAMAGIKVGDAPREPPGAFVTNVTDVTVERNRIHENEDTGIDLKSASRITVRQNTSYRNGDHGYDNLNTDATSFINNLASRNDHDGLSAEDDSKNVSIYNCVFSQNGVNPTTLARPGGVRELFIDNTIGLFSDYNVLGGLAPLDTVYVGQNYYRRLVEFPGAIWTTFAGYRDSTVFVDDHSAGSGLAFIDSTSGAFRPRWRSTAVVRADTTVTGWLATDASGVARHDCSGVNNTGNPTGAYADIGPYEYDDGMEPINVAFLYNQVYVNWTGLGRYGSATWKPSWFEIWVDGVLKLHRDNPAEWPGFVDEIVSASPCASHSVQVRTKDEFADTAFTNIVTGSTCCVPNCIERPDLSAKEPQDEGVDFPLTLGWGGPNPSRGVGTVSWSISRAQAGVPYELSLFDVAGRRVMDVASGMARAGRFSEELSFARDGARLANGVFFLRLRVGSEIRKRTVVLSR